MKYIDFGIQTLIFGFTGVLLGASFNEPGWPMAVLYGQLLMGPWQFFSSLISVASRAEFYKAKRIHLWTSIACLLMLWVGSNLEHSTLETLASFFLIVPAWILAFHYYAITIKWTFYPRKASSGFLRNLSF